MDALTLHNAIAEVAPVVSVAIGDPDDRSTWTWEHDGSATQAQIDAGDNVIDTIGVTTVPPCSSRDFIKRFTDAEYLLLKQQNSTDLTGGNIGFMHVWDNLLAADTLDLNSSDAQTLKSQLVSANILTQARADEIFSASPSPPSVMKSGF